MFLEQYWGGPRTYSDQRGHPRLRMRHVAVPDRPVERDAWLRCMRIAVDEAGLRRAHRDAAVGLPRVRRRPAWSTRRRSRRYGADPQDVSGREGPGRMPREWWRDAVFYQVYVRSFADSDGDGVGDLQGIRYRLGYLDALGVDALWLTPRSTPPRWPTTATTSPTTATSTRCSATSAAFDALIADAHAHGIRVTVDLVPNHTSDQHPWFRAALAAAAGQRRSGPATIFRPGRGTDGDRAAERLAVACSAARPGPGSARTAQWYLHLFAPEQPDLNWRNPEVVDGPREDAAVLARPRRRRVPHRRRARHGQARRAAGHGADGGHRLLADHGPDDPRFDQDGVHDIHRTDPRGARPLPGPDGHRRGLGADDDRFAPLPARRRAAPGLQLPAARAPVRRRRAARRDRATRWPRWAGGRRAGVGAVQPRPVAGTSPGTAAGPVGRARARAMALVQLALPGAAYIYNGDELGLPDVALPDEALQRPRLGRSGHRARPRRLPGAAAVGGDLPAVRVLDTPARPGCRCPRSTPRSPPRRSSRTPDPTLSLYRRALELRRLHPGFTPPPAPGPPLEWFGAPPGRLAFRRTGTTLVCALNTSPEPVPLPPGDPLLVSGPLDERMLPPDTAVWLA